MAVGRIETSSTEADAAAAAAGEPSPDFSLAQLMRDAVADYLAPCQKENGECPGPGQETLGSHCIYVRARKRVGRGAERAEPQLLDLQRLREVVESLYRDGILPSRVHVRRRLQETYGEDPEKWRDAFIRDACRSTPDLKLQEHQGCHFDILVTERQKTFVEPHGDDIQFPANIEEEVISGIDWQQEFTCNYTLAKYLYDSDVAGMQQYRLGEILQLVQKLISMKYIGHRRVEQHKSVLVRYVESDEYRKSCSGNRSQEEWDKVKANIQNLLQQHKHLSLSNFKRAYKEHFNSELREGELGFDKLMSLLQCDELRDSCMINTTKDSCRVVVFRGSAGCLDEAAAAAAAVAACGRGSKSGRSRHRRSTSLRVLGPELLP